MDSLERSMYALAIGATVTFAASCWPNQKPIEAPCTPYRGHQCVDPSTGRHPGSIDRDPSAGWRFQFATVDWSKEEEATAPSSSTTQDTDSGDSFADPSPDLFRRPFGLPEIKMVDPSPVTQDDIDCVNGNKEACARVGVVKPSSAQTRLVTPIPENVGVWGSP